MLSTAPLSPRRSLDLRQDAAALKSEMRARGMYERPFWPVFRAWMVHFALGVGGLGVFVYVPSLPVRAASMLLSCVGFIGLGTVGHTASHHAACERPFGNSVLLYVTYPFLLQVSACYWHYTHVQTHHPSPNVLGIDNDCDLRPLFALNERHQAGAGRLRWLYWKYQGLWFPLALCFNGFNIQRKGWRWLLGRITRGAASAGLWVDLVCMVLHVLVWIALPMAFFAPASVLAVYALRFVIIGLGLFVILAPGHFPAEAHCLENDQRKAGDFYLRQTVSTVNFRTGPLGRFLCSGLEYQIEHHLFPGISHVHYPKLAPLVRQLCVRHGLPYRSLGWGEAVWKSYKVFFVSKRVVSNVEALRDVPVGRCDAGTSHPFRDTVSKTP